MRVLVLGSGAREHALFWSCMRSPEVSMVYAAPGNGATQALNASLAIDPRDPRAVLEAITELAIDLTIIGPDDCVAAGVADALLEAGCPVFGPTAAAGHVESSKSYAKELMRAVGVPTADFAAFDDIDAAWDYARAQSGGMVVKADGLALGKGVIVCDGPEDALQALERMMVDRAFGDAGGRVVIEERMSGPELSVMCFVDGAVAVPMVPARDYKRAFNDDQGPNTGGMGAFSPPPDATDEVVAQVVRECAQPVVDELARRGQPYVGCLYTQVMLTSSGPRVVEYNARFGDPEAQVVLPRLRTDLVSVMLACTRGALSEWTLEWDPRPRVGVVLVSGGYPGPYATGCRVGGLAAIESGVLPFHAGTRYESGAYYTTGGRVLTLVAGGNDVEGARAAAYRAAETVTFDGAFYRGDIAEIDA